MLCVQSLLKFFVEGHDDEATDIELGVSVNFRHNW